MPYEAVWHIEIQLPRTAGREAMRARLLAAKAACRATHMKHFQTGEVIIGLTVTAETLREACDKALQRLEVALQQVRAVIQPTAIRAIVPGQRDHLGAVVGLTEIAELLDVSKQHASQIVQQLRFPKPGAVLARGPVYNRRSVERFAERWRGERERLSVTVVPATLTPDHVPE